MTNGWRGLSERVAKDLEKATKKVRDGAVETMLEGIVMNYSPVWSGNLVTNTKVTPLPTNYQRDKLSSEFGLYAGRDDLPYLMDDLLSDLNKIPTYGKVYITNNTYYNETYMDQKNNPYFFRGYQDGIEWLQYRRSSVF